MKTATVWVDDLTIPPRLRQEDAATVDALSESMSAIGLQQPISIYTVDDPDGGPCDAILVAGLHRLRAAQKLGWEKIEAFTVDLSETDRERWEISENLHRAELSRRNPTPVDYAATHKLAQVAPVYPGGRGNKGGVREAARELNISKDDARRSVKIGNLSPEAKDAALEAGLDDNQSALLAAAREDTAEQQVAVLKDRAEAKSTKNGLPCSREPSQPQTVSEKRKETVAMLRNQAASMEFDRDVWMGKAEDLEDKVKRLEAELKAAREEIEALKAAAAEGSEGGAA